MIQSIKQSAQLSDVTSNNDDESNTAVTVTSQFIKDISRDYSIYVCQSRGIPMISDGLKDAQRKGLFVIKGKTDKIKTISLSGEMLSSNIYLHGDASAAETLSHMAAPYCNNVPLLHGIGAFGTRVGPADWGAPRYTYLKKSVYTESLIYADYDIIPLKDNYDGSVQEPKHFLPLIPLVLLNGVSGIAVGWSTDILPRDLNDIIDATIAAIDNKPVTKLIPTFAYLDTTAKHLGDNAWQFTGKVRIEGSTVFVDELPPDLSLEKFKARLNLMEEEGKIQTYIDRSTKVISIEVRFKRGTIAGWDATKVIEFLKLRSKTTERIVVLDWDGTNIKQYATAEDVVCEFVEWRVTWYAARYQRLIDEDTYSLNFNLALKACIAAGLPAFLPKAADKAEITNQIQRITNGFKLDDSQRDRIVSLPSYRWAKNSQAEIDAEIDKLTTRINKHMDILSDSKKMRKIYRDEVMALRKLPAITR